jgi:hypothetical protein
MGLSFLDFVTENFGKIMVFGGVGLLIIGFLMLTGFGSLWSAISFFFGILLLAFGFFAVFGFFSGNLRSLNGLGTILICISVVFFALSLVVFQFLNIVVVGWMQEVFRGARLPFFRPIWSSERPYLWLSWLSIEVALTLLVIGVVLKVYYALRP